MEVALALVIKIVRSTDSLQRNQHFHNRLCPSGGSPRILQFGIIPNYRLATSLPSPILCDSAIALLQINPIRHDIFQKVIRFVLDNYIINSSEVTQKTVDKFDNWIVFHFLLLYCRRDADVSTWRNMFNKKPSVQCKRVGFTLKKMPRSNQPWAPSGKRFISGNFLCGANNQRIDYLHV